MTTWHNSINWDFTWIQQLMWKIFKSSIRTKIYWLVQNVWLEIDVKNNYKSTLKQQLHRAEERGRFLRSLAAQDSAEVWMFPGSFKHPHPNIASDLWLFFFSSKKHKNFHPLKSNFAVSSKKSFWGHIKREPYQNVSFSRAYESLMGCQLLSEQPDSWHWVYQKSFTDKTVTVLSQQLLRFTSPLSIKNKLILAI